ncbi:hypothetical protein [Parapedobacter lycopersici]|uniref:hypothetical protein n=1 Tax=Parapedobacter lycopersici TaxID=1864939 RepID=UPI00333F39E6
MENKKTPSLIARLRRQAREQARTPLTAEHAQTQTVTCPNCGAGRAKPDGLTHCAYCGHLFTEHRMTDGIHIKHHDNSNNNNNGSFQ